MCKVCDERARKRAPKNESSIIPGIFNLKITVAADAAGVTYSANYTSSLDTETARARIDRYMAAVGPAFFDAAAKVATPPSLRQGLVGGEPVWH